MCKRKNTGLAAMKFVPYHQQLHIRGTMSAPINDTEELNNWFRDLVKLVDMEILMEPWSIYVNDEGNEGITGIVCLSTSHSSLHIWDKIDQPLFHFDLYSCKKFDYEQVISWLDKMKLTSYEWMMIDRNDGLEITKQGENGMVFDR